ncbi:unnamed protein product [Ostreobium quekettii]|uniref:PHD-type domain-containing protein n=1 Tax=Ostreobium quekettii TaxID=121088 RepID=A0A8S1IQY3_9CHLO|nr:unnamed protein product [Ostreobium quekettii]|eukprot:evm.model.scf_1030EXC.3 EVM.evm.TU.scf_1030EXC.3   scf_1030EXC:19841-34134(+)
MATAGRVKCALCHAAEGVDDGRRGPFLGPVVDGRGGRACYVHRACALWSAEVYQTERDTFKKLLQAVKRGRYMKCTYCNRIGATIGCHVERCMCSYHLDCARLAGCTFSISSYSIGCPKHPQKEQPVKLASGPAAGLVRVATDPLAPWRVTIKPSLDWRPSQATPLGMEGGRVGGTEDRIELSRGPHGADHERQPAMEYGLDDRFREETLQRFKPMVVGAQSGMQDDPQTQALLHQVQGGFECVGGLEDVVQSLKEMVILPLLYPDVFKEAKPPRGILLHGPPGTGKTHVVRCLIGECAKCCAQPVAFFSHRASECLSENVGETEEALRTVFEEACRLSPSIVFLDELDALVPARSEGASEWDVNSGSVVATVLALMDGLDDRGAVTVIGATNRKGALDPALLRSGRFDREVLFKLPDARSRAAVLRVHTRGWRHPPNEETIADLVRKTQGMGGADLRHLCTLAVMNAVRSEFPGVLDAAWGDDSHQDNAFRLKKQCVLSCLRVSPGTWSQALHECKRGKQELLSRAHAPRPMPYRLMAALLPAVARVLCNLTDRCTAVPLTLKECAELGSLYLRGPVARRKSVEEELCRKLQEVGAVTLTDGTIRPTGQREAGSRFCSSSVEVFTKCRMLICGEGVVGQEEVAGCALRLLSHGAAAPTVVTVPCLVESGGPDLLHGFRVLLDDALQSTPQGHPCCLYIPRIETLGVTDSGYLPQCCGLESDASECTTPLRSFPDCRTSTSTSAMFCPTSAFCPESSCQSLCTSSTAADGVEQTVSGKAARANLNESDLLTVFQELVEQVPPSQPLIVLATMHCAACDVPPSMASFFSPECMGTRRPFQHSVPTIVEIGQSDYCRAMDMEARMQAEVHQRLCLDGLVDVNRKGNIDAEAEKDLVLQDNSNKVHQYHLRSWKSSKHRHQPSRRREHHPCGGLADAERQRALEQVAEAVRSCGRALLDDPRSRLVHFQPDARPQLRHRRTGGGERDPLLTRQPSRRRSSSTGQWLSLHQVARDAADGRFSTPEELCQAVSRVVRPLRRVRHPLQRRWQRWLGMAIADEISEWAIEASRAAGL